MCKLTLLLSKKCIMSTFYVYSICNFFFALNVTIINWRMVSTNV